MEFGIEKCTMLLMKSKKGEGTEGRELPNHESIKRLGEKENYKYLGILESGTIAHQKQKLKKKKKEKEEVNFLKLSSTTEILSKDRKNKHSGSFLC